jgi:hypothetical protein
LQVKNSGAKHVGLPDANPDRNGVVPTEDLAVVPSVSARRISQYGFHKVKGFSVPTPTSPADADARVRPCHFRPDDSHCTRYSPGHTVHFSQARLVGQAPWGWLDAVVTRLDVLWVTLSSLTEVPSFRFGITTTSATRPVP